MRLRDSLQREAAELTRDDRCFRVTVDPVSDAVRGILPAWSTSWATSPSASGRKMN